MPMPDRPPAVLRPAYEQARATLRVGKAATAEQQLRGLLDAWPAEPALLALLGAALLAQQKLSEARAALEQATQAAPELLDARVDLARAYRQQGEHQAARQMLREILKHTPTLQSAWLAYADLLVDLKQYPDARFAFERAAELDPERARIERATAAFLAGDRRTAETVFRDILKHDAGHLAALCGLAALALGAGSTQDAERLLRHALAQSAHAPLARRGLAHTLLAAGRLPEAEAATRELLALEPENPQNWVALGTVCTRLLRQSEALAAYEEAARLNPGAAPLRLSIGHLNKTLGRREACERAYRQCLEMDRGFAEAWWSLADLKNYFFSEEELAAMRALLEQGSLQGDARAQLQFALGRALEQRKRFGDAFAHYAEGNRLRRQSSGFDIAGFERKSQRVMACFDRALIERHRGGGCPERGPIFIVGLPRSGSTLIEQILASHSQVEGTMELPNLLTLVRELDHAGARADGYPEVLSGRSPEELACLGRRYLTETAPIRSGRPYFIDKMPNNFSHVGLLELILPQAIVIDVRRHPLDACLSAYKQYFAQGQSFSYDLEDLGRYYRCYLDLMEHWDRVLPGKVLHLQYEALVQDPERHIRRLLEHCGLSFEAACLRFHETQRPVRTASAEQVRQPLYRSGIGYWQHFASDLEPLRRSLGDALERFTERT